MIEITDKIALDEAEIVVTFIRAGGPGGQNVNKVSSAAQLPFDVRHSPSLPDAVRLRLERIAGARMTKDGEIVITAGNHVLRYLLAETHPASVALRDNVGQAVIDGNLHLDVGKLRQEVFQFWPKEWAHGVIAGP